MHIFLVPYGAGWCKFRKIVQPLLNINAVDNLLPTQNAEATQTLFQLLYNPEAVIHASVFGQRGASFDSPKVQVLYHA